VIWLYCVVGLVAGAAVGHASAKPARPLAMVLGAVLGGSGGLAIALSWYRPGWILLLVMLLWLWIGFVDFAEQRIPDRLSWAAAVVALVGLLGAAEVSGEWLRFGQAVAIGAVFAVAAGVWSMFGSLGWGDVKLSVSLGLMLGWQGWLVAGAGAAAAIVTAGVWGVVVAAKRRSWRGHVPLAPSWLLGVFGVIVATNAGL